MASCTNKEDHEETLNIPWNKEESVSLKFKPKRERVNWFAHCSVLVKYGRFDIRVYKTI